MFRHRRDARATPGADRRPVAPDLAVHLAEGFVRRAWALELAQRRERAEFAVRLELGNHDAAVALLIAAQRDGDPVRIGAARAAVLQALDAGRAAVAARDQARRALRGELRLLTRKPKKLSAAVRAGHPNRRGSAAAEPMNQAPDPQHAQAGSALAIPRSRIRRRRVPLRLLLLRRWTRALE